MKRAAVYFLISACCIAAAAGYCAGAKTLPSGQAQEESPATEERYAESSGRKAPSANPGEIRILDGKDPGENRSQSSSGNAEKPDEIQEVPPETETEPETAKRLKTEKEPETAKEPKTEKRPETEKGLETEAEPQTERKPEDGRKPEQKASGAENHTTTEHVPDNRSQEGGIEKIYMPSDIPPADTVGYVPSRKEEIMEDKYVESVVDENDPDSYQIVEKREQVPTLYVNQAGDIKYEYKDGIWYEYKYSNVNITLDTKDEKLALLILNLDGSYDDYEVVSINCAEGRRENGDTEYEFQVRYQGIFAMKDAPVDTGHLRAEETGRVAATRTVVTQEKVPVVHLESVGTGEYRYYGWQDMEEETFYFDSEGNEVTGSQVIQGIRHEFNEDGVRTSRAGVEVSEENGRIDWEKVAAVEVDFAVIRCAYRDPVGGGLVADSRAAENVKGAQAAGLEVLLSVFSQAVTAGEAAEEARYAVNLAKAYGLTAPVAVTCDYANPEHGGRADILNRSERTVYVNAFCQTIKENGYTPVIHAEKNWLDKCLIMEELLDNTLWVAEYNTNLTYTGTCEFWQYTSRGTVDGISGYTGLIISYENRRNFQ